MSSPLMARRLLRWTFTLAYTVSIFLLARYVPGIWTWLTEQLTTEGAGRFVDRAVPVLGLCAGLAVLAVARPARLSAFAWVAASLAGYAYLLTLHCEFPFERVHLLQYSLLAWLYYRSLHLDVSEKGAVIGAAFAVFIVGIADEGIQYFIPNRSMTLSDMQTNWAAGALGLIGLLALNRNGIWPWFDARGRVTRLATGLVIPLLLASALTHQVWTRYLYPPLNVIVITVDCARPDRMGFYGYERDTTMFLDPLAEQGAIFTNAFSQAAWTGPGVLSTLTGLYPPSHGVIASGHSIPKVVSTLQDEFRERGYSVPNLSYLTIDLNFKNLGAQDVPEIDPTKTDEISALTGWIDNHHREPFFIWYHYRHLHLPYTPAEQHKVFPPLNDPAASAPSVVTDYVEKEVIIPWGQVEFPDDAKPWIDALYDAQMRQFDHAFEAVRYRLALHHLQRNTLIVITADHGEELLEHGYIGHASTAVRSRHFDEHLRIPLLFYGPRVVPPGKVLDTPAQQVDIAPTILDLMGWDIPDIMQGRSLVPAIMGEPMESVPLFAESIEGGYQSKENMRNIWVRSIRTEEWKLIVRFEPQGDTYELFDLVNDPGETRNVFEENTTIGGELFSSLLAWISDNFEVRFTIITRENELQTRIAKGLPESLEIPRILEPEHAATFDYDGAGGAVTVRWTGNPNAQYVLQYHVGNGWHTLKGKMPIDGTEKVFGPVPRDAWAPLHQWNPFRLRVRPRALRDGWSEWIELKVEPLG